MGKDQKKEQPKQPFEKVSIPGIEKVDLKLVVGSDSVPVITHRFSEKNKKQIAGAQGGEAKSKRPPRDPEEECKSCLYEVPGRPGFFGIKALAFKKAAVGACRFADGISMTYANMAFHVIGDIVAIETPDGKPAPWEQHCDDVRIGKGLNKTGDLRYRPYFTPSWRVKLTIRYNKAALTPAQIINLFQLAGFHVGVGERRPEKGGDSFGLFEVME